MVVVLLLPGQTFNIGRFWGLWGLDLNNDNVSVLLGYSVMFFGVFKCFLVFLSILSVLKPKKKEFHARFRVLTLPPTMFSSVFWRQAKYIL